MALQPQAAAQLIEAIAGSGLYDLIVIDLDGGADVLHMAVFERCSHLFYVEEGTMTSIKKAECFLRYGRERWGEAFQAIERKMVSIRRMPAPAAASEAVSGEALRIAGLIDGRGRGHLPKLPEIPFIESWRTRGTGECCLLRDIGAWRSDCFKQPASDRERRSTYRDQ